MPRKRRVRPPGAFSKEGVDLTLIRWMLSMTPAQRLRTLQSSARSLMRLRSEAAKGSVATESLCYSHYRDAEDEGKR